jgi:hypothetical protein
VNSQTYGILRASEEEKGPLAEKLVEAVVKEVEPLLQDAKPFFGGSEKLTLAEVSATFPYSDLNITFWMIGWKLEFNALIDITILGPNRIFHPSSSGLSERWTGSEESFDGS